MLEIKSSVKNYNVSFSNNFTNSLEKIYNEGDIIIIDDNIQVSLENLHVIKINISEKTKSFEYIPILLDKILENFNKSNKLIAVGGGITQDIVSFISSILFRGVNWVFFPTTLLAQGDSCIGGKTSINYKNYKNQLGNFNPPNTVIICEEFLDTLPELDIKSGLGEMLHFYLVSGQNDFNFYKENYLKSKQNIIRRCLSIKKRFIEKDEFDNGERLLLNYGHTFGHAIESITNYKYPHGISVCLGMDIANYVSMKLGYITQDLYLDLKKFMYNIHNISYNIGDIEKYITALKKDKKNTSKDKLRCVLTKGIGKMFLKEINYNKLKPILKEFG